MKGKFFSVLQRVGRSFMLPIALLPVAGLLLGIGSSFTNATMLEAYNLTGIIHEGNILYTILNIMNSAGSVVFNNLALLFAVGVAIGMAKREKEVAALSGAIAYLIMNTSISALIGAYGGPSAMPENSVTSVLGVTTLQMGVFGGIIVGLGVAALHNRFYTIELPQVLSFFGGTRFVPIISALVYLVVGIIMFYVWPFVQIWISKLGNLVLNSGYIGTWIYGIIERALIPFGLHHVFYMPFWQTALGGSAVIDGELIQGAQNIYFAELASKSTEVFSVSATRFMAGKFPFMIFGLPGAAYAMYKKARVEKRKVAGGLLISAALTAMLTGITEPIEFTFLFVAPLMYGVHCVLAGLSYMLMHIFNVGVGMTFSGGLIDLTLFGILQGNAKTNWVWIVVVGIAYAIIYYFVFSFLISKFNFKTPGRESDAEETKLFTRKDMEQRKNKDNASALILEGLGGKNNISDLDCCATRLRVTVKDETLVKDALLKQSGASGVIHKGNGVQIVYGPSVSVVKSKLENYIDNVQTENITTNETKSKNLKNTVLYAHAQGILKSIDIVDDEVFSKHILGDGIAIEPTEGKLFAPADGVIDNIFDTNHAVNIITDDGCEILLHIGIDTIELGGKYFTPHVKNGQRVSKGDLLISFDIKGITDSGYKIITPMVICNSDEYSDIEPLTDGEVLKDTQILRLNVK